MDFTNIKKIFVEQNFKKRLLNILNAICLLFLFYNAIDMTFDYLRFEFSYKLIVDDNKEGFDLPEISVCTENNVLFAKNKVIQYFGAVKEWRRKIIKMENRDGKNENNEVYEICIEEWENQRFNFDDIIKNTLSIGISISV